MFKVSSSTNAHPPLLLEPESASLYSRYFQELKGLKEGEDPEDGEAKEEGVTFNIWKKTEQPPPAEPVFDEVIAHAIQMECFKTGIVARCGVSIARTLTSFVLPRTVL